MTEELLSYFKGDTLAAQVWLDKYAWGDEKTPHDMHRRLAREFARIEDKYQNELGHNIAVLDNAILSILSSYGRNRNELGFNTIFQMFKDFKYIIPQGSIMSVLGTNIIGSLSNCYVVPAPYDSYGGILKTDEELTQLMKRRAGVGTTLDTLRPEGAIVNNVAKTSTGADSFMSRYSNSTREVAQGGRRGALMLLMSCKHPSIFKFVTKKKDRTQVTGANVSATLTNKFMEAVIADEFFFCTFPINFDIKPYLQLQCFIDMELNKLEEHRFGEQDVQIMKIRAVELWNLIIEMAHENAEPGIAFIDNVHDYCPESVYDYFRAIACNPCGEQWLNAYDSCRLFALNLYSMVDNPFSDEATINYDNVYRYAYEQQRLADDLIDLELERIDAIIEKIKSDPEPDEVKKRELTMWQQIYKVCNDGRRTGCGITGLGDMLAAIGYKYDSEIAMEVVDKVMRTKMEAELDCTIDLAILRGTFRGWDRNVENTIEEYTDKDYVFHPKNDFYRMLMLEFNGQYKRMIQYGRRNVSWSTIAPTGTVSLMTQTTSGCEPLFQPYYTRRTKINPSENKRVDFVDPNGDSWTEYPVLHPKFYQWMLSEPERQVGTGTFRNSIDILAAIDNGDKILAEMMYKLSPWYQSTANDIDYGRRIEIQAILQKYTTNAISSTINLPNTATKDEVAEIYLNAYKHKLKGVTVYRDGCRTGVLVSDTPQVSQDEFGYTTATKRPKELEAEYHYVNYKGSNYAIIVGMLNNKPYELFVVQNPATKHNLTGSIIKVRKGHYNFTSEEYSIENLDMALSSPTEGVLTRWISLLLRHGANPKFVIEQTDKSGVDLGNFTKVICRILKKYVPTGETSTVACENCGSNDVIFEEGCRKCNSCGTSKC